MLCLLQPSQASVPLWLALVGSIASTVVGSGSIYLATWLNRKRRSSVRADNLKTEAEARKLEIESLAALYEQLKSTRAELAQIIIERAKKDREDHELHAQQLLFLQSQIEIKTAAEDAAKKTELSLRDRAHEAANEIQRCMRRILEYEELLRKIEPPVVFTAFDFTPYKNLMRDHDRDL